MAALPDKIFHWLAAALIAAAGFAVYYNTLDGDWVWDDASSVLLHKHVQEPARLAHAASVGEPVTGSTLGAFAQLFLEDQHAFGRGQGNFYRPLLSVTFAIDYLLSYQPELFADPPANPSPFIFHLQSTAWHIAAALLLLAVLARLGAPRVVTLAVPLLWVVHPLHTEAVAYISGRADMMSGAFVFAALYFGLSTATGSRRLIALAASASCFTLGLLSKEATLIFPFLLLVALIARRVGEEEKGTWGRTLAPVLPAFVVLAIYIALRSTVLSFAEGGGGTAAPFGQRLYETLQSFALYIKLLFLPTGLHMERTLNGVGALAAGLGTLALVLLIALAVVGYRRGAWRIPFGVALFVLCWLPISGLFPLNAPMAEHWMYVPMVGFWLALAEAALLFPPPARRLAPIAAGLFLLLFSWLTVQRNEDWGSNVRLFQATLRENPGTMRVHYNLAVTFSDIEHNIPGAIRHYGAAAALAAPGSEDAIDARLSQAMALLDAARPAKALQVLGELGPALKQGGPDWAQAELLLTTVRALVALGQIPEATRLAQSASGNPTLQGAMAAMLSGAPLSEQLHLPGLVPAVR
jgi:hypothetical protein